MNPCKEDKRKAEAPSLSSWTLYLQAELVSAGWHPLFPEQVRDDLERDEVREHPQKKKVRAELVEQEQCWVNEHLKIKEIQRASMQVKQVCEKKKC